MSASVSRGIIWLLILVSFDKGNRSKYRRKNSHGKSAVSLSGSSEDDFFGSGLLSLAHRWTRLLLLLLRLRSRVPSRLRRLLKLVGPESGSRDLTLLGRLSKHGDVVFGCEFGLGRSNYFLVG